MLDAFPDPLFPNRSLMVMPYLRPFDDPEFVLVGDAIDFVTQMLEVIYFITARAQALMMTAGFGIHARSQRCP